MPEPREMAERAFTLLQEALHDSEARVAELSQRLDRRESPENVLEDRVEALTLELRRVAAERDRLKRDAGHLEEVVAGERARIEQLEKKLQVAESGPDKLTKKEINFWRGKAEDFDRATQSYRNRLAQLRRELAAGRREIERLQSERAPAAPSPAAERELEELRAALTRSEDVVRERDSRLAEISAELEKTRSELARKADEIAAAAAGLEAARSTQAELERRVGEADAVRAELAEARAQMAGLEEELRDERECATNLTEIANERRELIRTLEDRLEEAEERYEDTKWRLGKAHHFERLVRRRKALVGRLIDTIRAKTKANVALKAGLDGLRKHKAAAEAKQHQLLARMDRLKAKIQEHEETIARLQEEARAQDKTAEAEARVAELEQRIGSQAEVIQSLEEELKTARALKQADAARRAELEQLTQESETLRRELDTKNAIIEELQKDADEQQRKIAKLRGSENETLRLKTAAEKNQSLLDALQRENTQLREVLERNSGHGAATPEAYGNVAEK